MAEKNKDQLEPGEGLEKIVDENIEDQKEYGEPKEPDSPVTDNPDNIAPNAPDNSDDVTVIRKSSDKSSSSKSDNSSKNKESQKKEKEKTQEKKSSEPRQKASEAVKKREQKIQEQEKQLQETLTEVKQARSNTKFKVQEETAQQIREQEGIDTVGPNSTFVEPESLEGFLTGQATELEETREELQEFQGFIEEENITNFSETETGEFQVETQQPETTQPRENVDPLQELENTQGFGRRRDVAGEILIEEGQRGLDERTQEIVDEGSILTDTFAAGLSTTREALSGEGGVFQVLTDEERRENVESTRQEDREFVAGIQAGLEGVVDVGRDTPTDSPVVPGDTSLIVAGGATRAAGEIAGLTPEDREFNLGEGIEEFTGTTVNQAREDPVAFGFGAAVDTAVFGGAGSAASRASRGATRTARGISDADLSKGQAAASPASRVRPDVGPGRTPGPRSRVGPGNRNRVDVDIEERITTPDTTDIDTVFGGARPENTETTGANLETDTETEVLDQEINDVFAGPRTGAIARSRTEGLPTNRARSVTRSQSQARSQSRSRAGARTASTSLSDTFIPRPRPRARRTSRRGNRRRRTRGPRFGGLDSDSSNEDLSLFGGPNVQGETEVSPSLDAVLTGTTGQVDESETLSGFETRPIPVNNNRNNGNNNEEDLNEFF